MPTLTDSLIRRARPRRAKYEIVDAMVQSLALRVLPSGKKRFVLRVRRDGRQLRSTIGSVDAMTLSEARRIAAGAARDVTLATPADAVVTPPSATPAAVGVPPPTAPIRFRELVQLYIARHVETDALAPSTRKNYRRALTRLVDAFGEQRLDEIRFAHVEAFHRRHADRRSAANSYARVLNHVFTKAAQWDLYPWGARLPTSGLRYFREEGRERFLSPAERIRLDRALDEAASTPMHRKGAVRWSHVAAIRLLSLTGCRESEILDLRWDWIDRIAGVIRFPRSKTGKSTRPISGDVIRFLDELEARHRARGCPYVVYGRHRQRVHRSSLTDAWRRLRRRAGLDDVRIHDLRHSAASDALNAGVPLEVVGEILGHRSIKTTQRYAHLARQVTREGTAKMTRRILEPARAKRRHR